MTAMSPATRQQIKGYLEGFIDNLVCKYRGREMPVLGTPHEYLRQTSRKGQIKPFHSAIIPAELLRINEFERGFSSSLGSTFEECARLVALEHHVNAVRSHDISALVSQSALSEIERQVAYFEHAVDRKAPRPTFDEMVSNVLASRRTNDTVPITVRADLYVLASYGMGYFFEMKSPMPNKGQCLEVTQRLLRFHLLSGQPCPVIQSYFSMAYNPYGPDRTDYKWSFGVNYTPFDQAVLIGHEFWELIGGPTAYEELLEIYQEVGRVKGKYMMDALAFGF